MVFDLPEAGVAVETESSSPRLKMTPGRLAAPPVNRRPRSHATCVVAQNGFTKIAASTALA